MRREAGEEAVKVRAPSKVGPCRSSSVPALSAGPEPSWRPCGMMVLPVERPSPPAPWY